MLSFLLFFPLLYVQYNREFSSWILMGMIILPLLNHEPLHIPDSSSCWPSSATPILFVIESTVSLDSSVSPLLPPYHVPLCLFPHPIIINIINQGTLVSLSLWNCLWLRSLSCLLLICMSKKSLRACLWCTWLIRRVRSKASYLAIFSRSMYAHSSSLSLLIYSEVLDGLTVFLDAHWMSW